MSQANLNRSNSTVTTDPGHQHQHQHLQQYHHSPQRQQQQQPHSQVAQRNLNLNNTGPNNRNSHGDTNTNTTSNSATNLSCSTSASSIRSYIASPPPTQIHHPNQNTNHPSDHNPNSGSGAHSPLSLRSRTFDLHEFADSVNYQLPVDLQSSSPSVEDTIVARGVTYTDTGVPRQPHIILSPRHQNHNHIQTNHHHPIHHQNQHQHQQHYNLISKDITGPGLQPEELLTVETRLHQNQSYQRSQLVHQQSQQNLSDEDESLSIINNYNQRPVHRHGDHGTYTVRSDPNYYQSGAGGGTVGQGTNAGALKMITRQRATDRESTPPSLKSTIIDLEDETFQGLKSRIDSPPVPHVNGFGKSFRQRLPTEMPTTELHHHAVQDGTKIYQTNPPAQKHVQFAMKDKYCKSKTYLAPGLTPMDALVKTFLGNSPLIREILKKKQSKVRWWPIIFLECFLRSISAVSLAPNPISGALIFVAMIIVTPLAAMLGSLALISGIVTAIFIVQMPIELVRSGGVTFNSYLLGTAIGELSSDEIWRDRSDVFIVSIALGSIIIFVCCGLDGMVTRRGRVRFPLLNSPFNVTALLYVTSGLAGFYKVSTPSVSPPFQGIDVRLNTENSNFSVNSVTPGPGPGPEAAQSRNSMHPGVIHGNAGEYLYRGVNVLSVPKMSGGNGLLVPGGWNDISLDSPVQFNTTFNSSRLQMNVNLTLWDMSDNPGPEIPIENVTVDWALVLQGVLLAPSQFYGTKTMWSSAVVYIAWLLFSPILFCQTVVGAFIGNLIGVALDDPPFTTLYTGGWAYNSLLTSAALGGLYFILNLKSWLVSVVGSVLSTLVFAGMLKANLPTLGIPFMLTTWILLPSTFNYQEVEDPNNKNAPAENGCWSLKKDEPLYKKWLTLMRVPLAEIQTPEVHLMEHWKSHRKSISRIIPALSKVSAAAAELHI